MCIHSGVVFSINISANIYWLYDSDVKQTRADGWLTGNNVAKIVWYLFDPFSATICVDLYNYVYTVTLISKRKPFCVCNNNT